MGLPVYMVWGNLPVRLRILPSWVLGLVVLVSGCASEPSKLVLAVADDATEQAEMSAAPRRTPSSDALSAIALQRVMGHDLKIDIWQPQSPAVRR